MTFHDCQSCGACCVNLPENVAEGYTRYVEVEQGDGLRKKKDLLEKLTVTDPEGSVHMRLAPDGRCLALKGKLGRRVWCDIYYHRPSPCRRVEAGGDLCQKYRVAQGLPP